MHIDREADLFGPLQILLSLLSSDRQGRGLQLPLFSALPRRHHHFNALLRRHRLSARTQQRKANQHDYCKVMVTVGAHLSTG